jgi:hypothetical protein
MGAHDAKTAANKALSILMALLLALGTCIALPGNASAAESATLKTGDSIPYGGYNTTYMWADGEVAYCVDPSASTPAEGSYAKHAIDDADLVAAMWFSYGAPGFDKSMWPDTWYDGSGWSSAKYQAASHVLLSRVYQGSKGAALYGTSGSFDEWARSELFGKTWEKVKEAKDKVGGGFKVFYLNTGSGHQDVMSFTYHPYGSVSVDKSSSIKPITDGNGAYNLKGAEYTVYSDKACTKAIGTIVTDKSGDGTLDEVPVGSAWVKETKSPEGYAVDGGVYEVEVKAEKTAKVNGGSVKDTPQSNTLGLMLVKLDADTGEAAPQGDGSLAGAQFACEYFDNVNGDTGGKATRIWTFQTDNRGEIHLGDKSSGYFVGGDNLYRNSEGDYTLPLGTYRFTETQAPEGYNASSESQTMVVKSKGDSEQSDSYVKFGNTKTSKGAAENDEDVIRGGVIIDKQDSQTGTDEQGDATFKGAEFQIVNISEGSVWVEGKLYEPGQVVKTIETGEDHAASTSSDCLPYGTYRIEEAVPPVGYLNQGSLSREFQIRTEGETVDLRGSEPISNDVIRGGVMVQKRDKELGRSEAIGGKDHSSTVGANLNGIEFEIANASAHRVIVGGASYEPGATIMTITTSWNEVEQAYTAQTPEDALPYGTYSIRETKTNDSYLLTDGEPKQFQVRREGVIVKATPDGGDLSFDNQVVRQDLRVTKKAAGAPNESLQVPFLITNVTTGESHVICTDRNGDFSTASNWNKHTRDTNANDSLIDFEGTIKASDMNSRAGVWFGLAEDGSQAEPDDSLAALPYGEYRLSELRCEANEGYQLIDKSFWVERDSTAAEPIWMSLTDEESPSCRTEAVDASDGDHIAQAGKVSITDTVSYENLVPGNTYKVSGTLMDKGTGDALLDVEGNPITASAEFECKSANGTVEVTFNFDAGRFAGKTLVAFEEVSQDGSKVCAHADIEDEGQSVKIVDVHTTAADKADGDKEVSGNAATIVDQVAYEGLTPGEDYTVEGTLMDAATGKALLDADGRPVTGTAALSPEEASGTIEVEFAFDASGLGGHDLVAFEKLLSTDGTVLAVHEDLSDKGQTVTAVEIGTTLTDAADSDHMVPATGTAKVTDEVAYKGLETGKEYTVSGKLMVKSTGKALVDKDGKEVTAEATFTPESTEGTVSLDFEFDASLLAGEAVVAFEAVSRDGVEVAAHADIDDEGQTVRIAEIGTTLLDSDKDHSVDAGKATLTDTVGYVGLVPGQEYTVEGTLMDKSTGEALKIGGDAVTASAKLTPESSEGSAEVTFEFDASGLADGSELVAFERLLDASGSVVAVHEDIDDEGQTVTVEVPEAPSSEEAVGKGLDKTGVDLVPYMLGAGIALAAAGALAAYGLRRRKGEQGPEGDDPEGSGEDETTEN